MTSLAFSSPLFTQLPYQQASTALPNLMLSVWLTCCCAVAVNGCCACAEAAAMRDLKRQRGQYECQQRSTQEGQQQPDGSRARALLPTLRCSAAAHPSELVRERWAAAAARRQGNGSSLVVGCGPGCECDWLRGLWCSAGAASLGTVRLSEGKAVFWPNGRINWNK